MKIHLSLPVKMKNLLIFSALLSILFLPGCLKKESYPDVPQIGFLGYENVFDSGSYATRGIFMISYTDGDGDIGLSGGDTLAPYNKVGDYYYNLVIRYYEKQKGVFQLVQTDPPFSARIPLLSKLGERKAIKGTITDTLVLNPKPVYDTIRFEIFIYDRALHKSNVVTTPVIVTRRH
ncbi:MAG: hypothetical protein Q8867_11570 [Bacteroidota bacterium]|nr:hypothetical protein [Bacteroidota bacterium]